MKISKQIALIGAMTFWAGTGLADPVAITTVLDPKEQMRFELGDGSAHFVLAVRREGVSEGEGMLAGAKVTEFGWHDIAPPLGGDPRGYLRFESESGDVAVVKFTVRAVFMKGADKPVLHDDGFWELVSGTGEFGDKRGVGVIKIEPDEGPKRLFTLTGEIGDKP